MYVLYKPYDTKRRGLILVFYSLMQWQNINAVIYYLRYILEDRSLRAQNAFTSFPYVQLRKLIHIDIHMCAR